ncbi:hypothetical protein [uncultured Algibacter sp.]|uniref:hypothetical protein n=1 Tax=uncultured Algibacter sp. TaxID=298659 RepID=UPI002606C9A2|nr:hypothetical protein [uncultured Algibacter sp.]
MLSDKQSLILCGVLTAGIFVTGILNILDNFVVLTVLTIVFLVIIGNLLYVQGQEKEDTPKDQE